MYDSSMIGRRGFLKLLPALVAAPALARALPTPAPLRIALSGPWEGLHWYEHDGTISDRYAGVSRDAYVGYLTFNYALHVVPGTPATSGRIDDISV